MGILFDVFALSSVSVGASGTVKTSGGFGSVREFGKKGQEANVI